MSKRFIVTEEEKRSILSKYEGLITEDEMMGVSKKYTLSHLGIKETSYMTNLKGTTPFMVNGVEVKRNQDIQPTDELSSKDCMVDFVTNKTKRNFTLIFQKDGSASIER